ncbi:MULTISPECIES: hypothetical protein [unclassified Stenotrophomonas]|uniref:hypothetical protein n=1 Tax=unclassified Stenotrophomonas TaxID=196198 RepID=UPI002117F9DA|nr:MULTISPECIES: hypothetical protein [unclassified Stenotrophomonas]
MRNTLVFPARRAPRVASTASLLFLLPLAIAMPSAQAQSLPAADPAPVAAVESSAAVIDAIGQPEVARDPGEAVDAAITVVDDSQAVSDVAVPADAVPASDVAGAHGVVADVPEAPVAADVQTPAAAPASSAAVGADVATAAAHAAEVETVVDGVSVPTTRVVAADGEAAVEATVEATAPAPESTPALTPPPASPEPPAPAASAANVQAVPAAAMETAAAEAADAAAAGAATATTPAPTPVMAEAEVATPPPVAAVAPKPAFVNVDHAIERQLGARCPNDLAARLATQGDLLTGACQGTMPAHLAAVLVAIPDAQILLPRVWRQREVAQRAWFKAVPGAGQRPDFLAVQGGLWIRSFEGADANTTVYLVSAPFECVDGRVLDADAAEPVRVPAGDCRQAFVQERVYRVSGNAAPVDITAEVMPARPLLGEADKKRYAAKGGEVTLDRSKLQYGPAMRWYVRFDEAGTPADARSFGEWSRAHLGFVVWNGQRFEQVDSVPRSQWPCDPVAPGDAVCGGFADAGRDPFVLSDAAMARTEGATP